MNIIKEHFLDEIKDLIEDSLVNEYVRSQGVHTLLVLVLNGVLEREDVVEYFKYLLNAGLKDKNTEVITAIVCYASDLHPGECCEGIKRLLKSKIYFKFMFEQTLVLGHNIKVKKFY